MCRICIKALIELSGNIYCQLQGNLILLLNIYAFHLLPSFFFFPKVFSASTLFSVNVFDCCLLPYVGSFCCAVVHAVVGRAHCGGYEGLMFLCGSDNDTVELRQCRQADFSDWNLWFFLKIEKVLAS
jgi:hypothetical protein